MKPISELKISPRPWRPYGWNGEVGQRCWTVESSGQTTVCELNRNEDTHPDACLLAAAPEMYEALYEAELELCIVAPMSRCMDKIRSALAKAAGEVVSNE